MIQVLGIDPGTRNLGVCLLEWEKDTCDDNSIPKVVKWEVADVLKSGGTKPDCDRVCDYFDTYRQWLPKETFIVVEKQDPTNTKMRDIAATIYGFFRGMGFDVKYTDYNVKVRAIEVIKKFHGVEEIPFVNTKKRKRKNSSGSAVLKSNVYKINKSNVVNAVAFHLLNTKSEKEYFIFEKHEKKDDLCDAYLISFESGEKLKVKHFLMFLKYHRRILLCLRNKDFSQDNLMYWSLFCRTH